MHPQTLPNTQIQHNLLAPARPLLDGCGLHEPANQPGDWMAVDSMTPQIIRISGSMCAVFCAADYCALRIVVGFLRNAYHSSL